MALGSDSEAPQNPMNPPPPPSSPPPPPILTAASFYVRTQTIPYNYNFPYFRWNTNHQHHNFIPSYNSTTLNLGSRFVLTPQENQILNMSNGSSSPLRTNNNPPHDPSRFSSFTTTTRPVLHLGPTPPSSHIRTSHTDLLLGLASSAAVASSTQDESRNTNTTPYLGSSSRNRMSQLDLNRDNNDLGGGVAGEREGEGTTDTEAKKEKNVMRKIKGKPKISVKYSQKQKEEESDHHQNSDDDDDDDDSEGEEEDVVEEEPDAYELAKEPSSRLSKTWNLRPRKPVTKPPKYNGGNSGGSRRSSASRNRSQPPLPTRASKPRPGKRPQAQAQAQAQAQGEMGAEAMRREQGGGGSTTPLGNTRPTFSMTLTKEEIEEDFMKMIGEKPSKKPNKRPKIVQRNLDACFPGLWLGHVNVDLYNIPDPPLKA